MSQLLPPHFTLAKSKADLPFITQAEFSTLPYPSACCHFNLAEFSPTLIKHFGFVLPESLRHAVKKRQAEYLASRWLVAELLDSTNIKGFQLLNREDRSPIWPTGVYGSLSHHADKVFVILNGVPSLVGNDIELTLSEGKAAELYSMIMNDNEVAIMTAAGFSLAQATTLVFSVKETVYKAVYPRVQRLFGFEQVTVQAVDTQRCQITVTLSSVAQPAEYPCVPWHIHYWQTASEVMSWQVVDSL